MIRKTRRARGLSPILFALAFGAYASSASAHHDDLPDDAAHDHAAAHAEPNEAAAGYAAAMQKMHEGMAVESTGNADADFVIGMIPHHQAAIDMAEIVLEHGEDPEIRKLAEEVISAQQGEIEAMREWLDRNGFDQSHAGH